MTGHWSSYQSAKEELALGAKILTVREYNEEHLQLVLTTGQNRPYFSIHTLVVVDAENLISQYGIAGE
jgi:hypothetical protein